MDWQIFRNITDKEVIIEAFEWENNDEFREYLFGECNIAENFMMIPTQEMVKVIYYDTFGWINYLYDGDMIIYQKRLDTPENGYDAYSALSKKDFKKTYEESHE